MAKPVDSPKVGEPSAISNSLGSKRKIPEPAIIAAAFLADLLLQYSWFSRQRSLLRQNHRLRTGFIR
jgi:hypothetical protein